MGRLPRVLLHLSELRCVAVDPSRVYLLEADGDDTLVRMRRARPIRDVRHLRLVAAAFEPHGILRVHHDHAVNLLRVREVRRRKRGGDWEVALQPPVGRVLEAWFITFRAEVLGQYRGFSSLSLSSIFARAWISMGPPWRSDLLVA